MTQYAVAIKNESGEYEIERRFDSLESIDNAKAQNDSFGDRLSGNVDNALYILEREDADFAGAWWLFDRSSEDEPAINPFFDNMRIPVYSSKSNGVLAFYIDRRRLPFFLQVLAENGDLWGAYVQKDKWVFVEFGGKEHEV